MTDGNGWNEWEKFVLAKLDELSREIKDQNQAIQKLHVDILTLKIKASVWGMVAGTVPTVVASVLYYLFR